MLCIEVTAANRRCSAQVRFWVWTQGRKVRRGVCGRHLADAVSFASVESTCEVVVRAVDGR